MKILVALLTIGTAAAQYNPLISVEDGVKIATISSRPGTTNAFSGAPFAGKESQDNVQMLPNGGHVARKTQVTLIWQDSEGRRRLERQYFAPNNTMVTVTQILDPVEGAIYVLDPEAGIAHRFKEKFRVTPVLASAVPRQRPPSTTPSADGSTFTIESIGTQVIGGITAYGSRTTKHYPAGSAQNDQPFDFITEAWNSPQVGGNLLFKIQDPRSGDSTIKLENVVLAEPNATLLKPPLGYRVVDETGTIQIKVK